MSKIRFLVMDVDGTLTDGKIYMGTEGEIFKAFDIKDGYAIHSIIRKYNIIPIIITGRCSKIVENRAKELCVLDLYQGVSDKLSQLQSILQEKSIDEKYGLNNVAYIGDDLNDVPIMQAILESGGITAAPQNAIKEVKEISSYVCGFKGGEGAVREFIEYLISQ